MKLYIVLGILSVAIWPVVHGKIPDGKNVKTSITQLSLLDKMLIQTFHPTIDLNQIAASEDQGDKENVPQDDYTGIVELFQTEVPLLLLQLVKLGDDILLPNLVYEYGWNFCFVGVCSGFIDVYRIRNARLKTVTTTTLHASMNGTKFRVEFTVPDLEIQCPECTYENTNYDSDSPSDNTIWRGYSVFVKNYSLVMTGDFGWNIDRIGVKDLDINWEIEELWDRKWNATYTAANGTQEEWSSQDHLIHVLLLRNWARREEEVEENVEYWLNCYLSNGRSNKDGGCDRFFNEPLHNITAAEILHTFGLAALNKHRPTKEDLSREIYLNAADPIDTLNRILFDIVPHVMQSGKLAAALVEYVFIPIPFTFAWVFKKEICSENSTGEAACETFQEQITIGGPFAGDQFPTNLIGALDNRASLTFDVNTVSYSFHVADLALLSIDYQRILTNLNTGDQQVFGGLDLHIFNGSVGFVADYVFDEDAGHYAISMKKIELFVDKVTMDIYDVSVSENGVWKDLPSIHKEAAPMVMELWEGKDSEGVSYAERYRVLVEDKINAFLAGEIAL